MNRIIFLFFIGSITLLSCKREKVEVVGPEIAFASSDFKVASDSFAFNSANSDFSTVTSTNWFNASFNERVSWEIKISGTQSKAYKIISGVSDGLTQANSSWNGSHTNVYFFIEGEQAVAELTILGSDQKWYDTTTITVGRKKYGPNVIIWWDMVDRPNGVGVAQHGYTTSTLPVYWYHYFESDAEKVEGFMDSSRISHDPVQGPYRAFEGKDVNADNYVGGLEHTYAIPAGFDAPLDDVYLNFYIRRRSTTTSLMNGFLKSVLAPDTSKLSFTVNFSSDKPLSDLLSAPKGYVNASADGWSLVSIKLSSMNKVSQSDFNPKKIVQFGASLGPVPGASSGFDIDFITITHGAPFDSF